MNAPQKPQPRPEPRDERPLPLWVQRKNAGLLKGKALA